MAEHTLAILVKAIGAQRAAKDLRGVDKAVSNIGAHAGRGLRNAGRNVAIGGAAIGAGIALAVQTGLQDLAELEDAVTSVDGAIKTMGLTGKVTGGEIAGWANEIETAVGAAFDDKAITQATTTLIRFGRVTPGNIRPAMEVMTDLATKTGDVDSAASLLSKALADPTKAAGKLARQGIVLTKAQQKQIKAMVEAGDVAGAQAFLLDQVAKSTEGAAAASQGPYRRAISTLADVSEDARKALAEGFLPVIEKVAGLLSKELAKPSTMANIREFGQTLASGLDDLIDIAQKLPWGVIGESLKIAGQGAKTVLGAFSSLPPWVQTAVLTGWGLNKLTGGALGSIVGELGKGLIKGVLGMNAGVVNINAGVVNGGGVPGVGGGKGGGRFGRPGVGGLLMTGLAAGLGLEAFALQQQTSAQSSEQASTAHGSLTTMLAQKPDVAAMRSSLAAINTGINQIQSNPLMVLVQGSALDELKAMRADVSTAITKAQAPANAAANQASIASREGENAGRKPIEKLEPKVAATTSAVKNAQSIASRENSQQRTEIQRVNNATVTAKAATVSAIGRGEAATRGVAPPIVGSTIAIGAAIVAAIWASGAANRPVIQSTNVTKTTTVNNRYGPSGGWSDWNRDATR